MRKWPLFLVTVSGIVAAAVVVECWLHPAHRALNNLLYDNEYHYLPCSRLPTREEVERVLNEHEEEVRAIKALAPEGEIEIAVGDGGERCRKTGDIVFTYGSRNQHALIKQRLSGERWHGIPYRLINI